MVKSSIVRGAPVRKIAAKQRLTRMQAKCQERTLRRKKKVSGFLIAGTSLAALFGIAYLKGRADE